MCQNCGCSVTPARVRVDAGNSAPPPAHAVGSHTHESHRHESHQHLHLHEAILSKNDRLAQRNRDRFAANQLLVLNLLSSPGSGKTALLERTLLELSDRLAVAAIVGDLATDNDAQRLRRSGAPVVQINTESLCHLEAEAIAAAAAHLDLAGLDLLAIENVGNLVCPAAYDLGETLRVALLSTPEGEDKPLKYPTLYKSADAILVNKIDIADAVGFDRDLALNNLRNVAPQARIFEVSARSGRGLATWYDYLKQQARDLTRSTRLSPSRNESEHLV